MKLEGSEVLLVSRRRTPFTGVLSVPGDKSITHRALFFGALRAAPTIIRNPSPALDVRSTLEVLRALGYHILESSSYWELDPTLRTPHDTRVQLDCGNSGTTARLATGFLTGEEGEFILTGDESLSRRPMERVAEPLRRIGNSVTTTDGLFPVTVIANRVDLKSKGRWERISVTESEAEGDEIEQSNIIDVASAQVHGALVFAAARGGRTVRLQRTKPMRDHTLRLAPFFGMQIESRGESDVIYPVDSTENGHPRETVEIAVPGDLSSAAFLVAAALLVPESDLTIANVGLNPTRIAFLETVRSMGGSIEWSVESDHPEPMGSIRVRYSPELRGVTVRSNQGAPVELMMDELPLLAFVGSQASGETVIRDAHELRLKESDRIAATVSLLASLGIVAEELADGLRVVGPQPVKGGAAVNHYGDHRLAMLAGVAGLIAEEPVVIPEPAVADVSWPGVWEVLNESSIDIRSISTE